MKRTHEKRNPFDGLNKNANDIDNGPNITTIESKDCNEN